ncbi:hypothetical protein Rsub_05115 [Raphidocelis subcapitata]|uniref:RING-CH-type domain-containing protein n=1 Tax=Raphidocelis subcapitata TaxID=307507 RepID=A0A2V0NYQ5_9CHLO|nr:hypothetical protein Rsub_05115 [Raphidocelis subcapitata]|eukprot:GBF92746.1 hypothetical protein Rsub_05115 [Raphidocelis subcapitata]
MPQQASRAPDAPLEAADEAPLLEGGARAAAPADAAQPGAGGSGASPGAGPAAATAAAAAALQLKSAVSADIPVCRICLEDDSPANLLAPCSCTGTQKWAHRACLQRWIDEKRSPACEICGHDYSGGFTVPPPPPPPAAVDGAPLPQLTRAEREALRHILSRLVPPGGGGGDGGLVLGGGGPGGGVRVLHLYGDEEAAEREPAVSWLAAAMTLVLLTLLFQSSLEAGGGAAGGGGGPGGGGGGGIGPAPPGPPDDDGGAGGAGMVLALSLFAVWVLGKLLGAALPLLLGGRLSHGLDLEAGDADSEVGTPPPPARVRRIGGARYTAAPAGAFLGNAASPASDLEAGVVAGDEVELQRLGAEGGGGAADAPARRHPFLLALHALQQASWRRGQQPPSPPAQQQPGREGGGGERPLFAIL